MATILYALTDPRTDEVRYIGKTNDINVRQRCHRYEAKKGIRGRKATWYRSLTKIGLEPKLVVLCVVPDDSYEYFERELIRVYRRDFPGRLVNLTDGGEGAYGRQYTHSEETKRKLSIKSTGFKHSDTSHAKMSVIQKALDTPERRAAISARMIGNKPSPEAIENMSKAHIGKTLSDATKVKLCESQRRRRQREKDMRHDDRS